MNELCCVTAFIGHLWLISYSNMVHFIDKMKSLEWRMDWKVMELTECNGIHNMNYVVWLLLLATDG